MSELESHKMVDEKYCTDCVCVIPSEVYLKSEADKVIKDLENRLQAANKQIENLINSASSIMLFQDKVNDNKCKELRYQKYKRCMAMAEMCNARYDEEDAKVNGNGTSWEYISKEMKYWERWR